MKKRHVTISNIYGFTSAFEIKIDFEVDSKSIFSFEYDINKDLLIYAEYKYFNKLNQENASVFKFYKHFLKDSLEKKDIVYLYQSPDHDNQILAEIDFEKFVGVLNEFKTFMLLKIGE